MASDRARQSSGIQHHRSGCVIEALESRRLLAVAHPDAADTEFLTRRDVERILGRAGSQASAKQIVAVVDREGNILGVYGGRRAKNVDRRDTSATDGFRIPARNLLTAVTRARTAAFFQSTQNAFTTRTARFIIQDHFPHPVPNTPGGPLFGVQFSSLPGSDVFSGPAISGDPGGIPLYKNGVPVGGIGVAGDRQDVAARDDLLFLNPYNANPRRLVYGGDEESDFDEQVALAGASSFMAPPEIRADRIFLDGLRLPFTVDAPADKKPSRPLAELLAAGEGTLRLPDSIGVPLGRDSSKVRGSPKRPIFSDVPFPITTFAGVEGQLKNTALNPSLPTPDPEAGENPFGIRASNDADGNRLSGKDVKRIIEDAVAQAIVTRAAIREPIGVSARVHVAVVDRDGDLLAAFRMRDGTNFSFDVAVQKARTAAFFSDDSHALSTRAIGFLAQSLLPPGINASTPGPLRGLQNQLSFRINENGDFIGSNLKGRLRNGITIFPGGVPLYKNGELVGAVGISGDGVDQDDLIAFAGAKRFQPPAGIRSDQLSRESIADRLERAVDELVTGDFYLSKALKARIAKRLRDFASDSQVRLPYVKFPRNPLV